MAETETCSPAWTVSSRTAHDDEFRSAAEEGIAVIGIGCKLPGAITSHEEMWSFLASGQCAISEVPSSRWSLEHHHHPDPEQPFKQHVRQGGFVSEIDRFDAAFFGISPREAVCMDPQQRMLLETTWRCLEDAGCPLEELKGQPIGVFVGISSNDYGSLLWASEQRYVLPGNEPYVLPGNTGCIAANRLSYVLDLKGPSFTVDTACSSSLVAVHLACESLRRGESSMALVGGVQALIHPGIQATFCKAGLLAPDGLCKSFDAAANGYVRAEGAGMVLLKTLAAARRDGDRIHAVIRGSAINSDGRSNGMVAPDLQAQIACVRAAFARAGLDPASAQYVEAHGTGTRQGDPIELRALGTVLGEGRAPERPCRVGSVKTNLGHSETAAGITGLIKACLCLAHRQLPPSLHFTTPNPAIDFQGLKLQVQTRLEPFPEPARELVVGVSSFGFGGTNAHVVLSEAPATTTATARYGPQPPLQLLALSARSAGALQQLAGRYVELLEQVPAPALQDLCASSHLGRSAFRQRLVCLAGDSAQLRQQLLDLRDGRTPLPRGMVTGQASRRPGKLAWLFTGQGSQSPGMAAELLERHPRFREAFERVSQLLDPHLDQPLSELIAIPPAGKEEAAAKHLAQTGYAQPALFAIGYALSQLWLSWGVEPDLLLGHSIGEVLAAHLAGVFSLEDACRLVIARAQLMQALPGNGGMAALLCPAERLGPWLTETPEVTIAAWNGPHNTVISGPQEPLQRVMARAGAAGIEVRPLRVSHAFHSAAMAPMLERFEQALQHLHFSPPSRLLISNLSGTVAGSEIACPGYWCEHVINPVRFQQGIEAAASQGCQVYLEIGARPTLIGMTRQCLEDPALTTLPSLLPDHSDWSSLYNSLAQLYVAGHPVRWRGFHEAFAHQRIPLPGYPFETQSFWWPRQEELPGSGLWHEQLDLDGSTAAGASRERLQATPEPVDALQRLDLPGADRRYQRTLRCDDPADLQDHRIRGVVVFPAAGFIEQACSLLLQEQRALRLRDLKLEQPLKLGEQPCPLLLELRPGDEADGETLLFHSRRDPQQAGSWICHGQARLVQAGTASGAAPFTPAPPPAGLAPVDLDAFYGALAGHGLEYGPRFRALFRLVRSGEHAWAELQRPSGGSDRGLLDSCFQAVAALLDPTATAGQLLLPVGLNAMQLAGLPLPDRFSCQVLRRSSPDPALVVCDLVFELDGTVFGWIEGFRLRRLPRQALEWLFPSATDAAPVDDGPLGWLIGTEWQDLPTTDVAPQGGQDDGDAGVLLLGCQPQRAAGLEAWCNRHGRALSTGALGRLPEDEPGEVVIWPELNASCSAAATTALCGELLSLVQQLASGPARPVWLVLEGTGASQGALSALLRTAVHEYPQLRWTQLHLPGDVDHHPDGEAWEQIRHAAADEGMLRWHDGRLQAARLERLAGRERFRLATSRFGSLEDLSWQPLPRQQPAPGELEVAVEATGLNFRDVLNALGLLATYSAQLGMDAAARVPFGGECVGVVVAAGSGVDPSWVGRRVIAALAVGSLASHVLCRAELCLPLPQSLSAEQGASLSTVFLTALYGLETLAGLQPGETVLIHAAAGGVGQAALQVARARGARILATASSAKQAGLLEQGVEAVFDSRSLDFSEAVLAHTQGRGVDVVLNSLKGDWVEAGFRALAVGGRFVELGKIEIWSREQAAERRPDARYLPFDLLEVAAADPGLIRDLLQTVLERIEQGSYTLVPLQSFPIERSLDAFRLMAQARHVGKVVIHQLRRPRPLTIQPGATYLVTGGFGGLGLQLLEWLAARGARSLIALGRGAASPSAAAERMLERLEAAGVTCRRVALDLGTAQVGSAAAVELDRQLAAVAADQPLAGVFHTAGVLDDGPISGQSTERLQAVMAPKLAGWELLHQLVGDGPFHVAFSSMASLLGSPGQATYSAANGALDGDCLARSLDDDSAGVHLAIQWGPWGGAGMAASLAARERRRLEQFGVALLDPTMAFEALELALQRGRGGQLAVLDNDWDRIASHSTARQRAMLAPLLQGGGGDEQPRGQVRQALLTQLEGGSKARQLEIVVTLLRSRLAAVMGLEDDSGLDPHESLFHIGLDSLMAVELAATVQRDLDIRLELDALASDPTLEGLGRLVLAKLQKPAGEGEAGLDLAQQAELPEDWAIESVPMEAPAAGRTLLLTGASGFLGAYLLAEQLRRFPDLQVRCLVRGRDQAECLERIRANLQSYHLWDPDWESRIEALPGDLSKPGFGHDPQAFLALAEGVTGILHNGAQLSQMASYSQLEATNVAGTRRILQLAAQHGGIPVQMISSVAVFEATAYRNREILETDDISAWEGIYNGYSKSKWVSERLVINAGRRGLPVTIYRPPLIAGDSRTGAWRRDDLLYRLLKGCLQLGLAADVPWQIDMVPVDYVAAAVGALSWRPDSQGRCYHLQHPRPILLNQLLQGLIAIGAPLKIVSMAEWLQAIEAQPSNPLHPMRAFFQQRWGPEQLTYPELNQTGVRARPSAAITVAALAELGVHCPDLETLAGPYGKVLLSSDGH